MVLHSFLSFLIVKLIFFLRPVISTSLQIRVLIIFTNKFIVFNYKLSNIKEGFFLVILLLNCGFLPTIFLYFLI